MTKDSMSRDAMAPSTWALASSAVDLSKHLGHKVTVTGSPAQGGRLATFNVEGRSDMVKVALWVRLEAKPGKEADVEGFLRGGLPLVQAEPATTAWFGLRLGPSTFGIFDAFPDEAGRNAHLSGRVAAALMEKASDLLAQPPTIEKVDVLAAKLPG
jgi:quinol monooxygenase YgiN